MKHTTQSIELVGTLAGHIWMPNYECHKDVRKVHYPDGRPFGDFRYSDGSKPTIRDMVLAATNDGDFQSCELLDDSFLKITRRNPVTGTLRVRTFAIAQFASVQDCLRDATEFWDTRDFTDKEGADD